MDLSRVCCQEFTQTTALDSDDKVSPRTLMCGLRSMPNSQVSRPNVTLPPGTTVRWRMSGLGTGFDPIGIVIDWLDACRERRLEDLLALYADQATLDCCSGERFIERSGLLRYWPGKLRGATEAAFELDEVLPEQECVRLDYRDYDGSTVSTKFWFDAQGGITRTLCVPLGRKSARVKAA
jgi:hypothetical protein